MSAQKKILLGCIADDFTGATDLANNLVRAGMRVVQTIGVPGALRTLYQTPNESWPTRPVRYCNSSCRRFHCAGMCGICSGR